MTEPSGFEPPMREEPIAEAEEPREESWDERWKSDRVDAVGWAALLIWAAVVVLATNTSFSEDYSWWNGWGVFFVGAGVINLAETVARLFMPAYRSKWWWKLLWGVGFLSFGLGVLFGWAWLALFLVAVAIVILRVAFTRMS